MADKIKENAQAIQGCGCALLLAPLSLGGLFVLYLILFT